MPCVHRRPISECHRAVSKSRAVGEHAATKSVPSATLGVVVGCVMYGEGWELMMMMGGGSVRVLYGNGEEISCRGVGRSRR